MVKTILILGASYVGLAVTHSLLKKTIKDRHTEYKIALVSPTTHHYWNMASVRAIIPGQIPEEKLFASIPDGLAKYGDRIELIIGTVKQLNITSKSVNISTAHGERQQEYDILIISTGSRPKESRELPWYASMAGYESTRDTLRKFQKAVTNSKSIVLGGGGPTGVETAGELGFEFGNKKEISLITAGSKLLTAGTPAMSTAADSVLRKLQVNIIYETKVMEVETTGNNQTKLTLSNGTTMLVDLYLPTTGSIANTEFVPENLLDGDRRIIVDEFLRVKNAPDVWAAGDVANIEPPQYVYAEKQINALNHNLNMVINGKTPAPYKPGPLIFGVTLGRNKATGRLGPVGLPSIVLWFAKGRTLGTQNLQPLVSGSKF